MVLIRSQSLLVCGTKVLTHCPVQQARWRSVLGLLQEWIQPQCASTSPTPTPTFQSALHRNTSASLSTTTLMQASCTMCPHLAAWTMMGCTPRDSSTQSRRGQWTTPYFRSRTTASCVWQMECSRRWTGSQTMNTMYMWSSVTGAIPWGLPLHQALLWEIYIKLYIYTW